ncbi:MAG: hypothetical protein NTU61_06420 [Candidatus Altiarchaeota archaeon]|nr:hypothetical protein [Candidatus Altiarchaeota archaeon]
MADLELPALFIFSSGIKILMKRITTVFVLFIFLASMASAASEKGIIDQIMDLIRGILSKVGLWSPPTTTTTSTLPLCNPPYIQDGDSCCLDANNNGVCDGVEEITTTTVTTTTSTSTSTTSTTSTTTSTTLKINCYSNIDCGESKEEYVCHNDNVYSKRTSFICMSPGTPSSKCVERQVQDNTPLIKCMHGCAEGKCVNQE